MSKNSAMLVGAWLVGLSVIIGLGSSVDKAGAEAQPRESAGPYAVYQSGGNCVYIATGRYANFMSVVPVGPGGC